MAELYLLHVPVNHFTVTPYHDSHFTAIKTVAQKGGGLLKDIVMACLDVPLKPHVVIGEAFSEVAGSRSRCVITKLLADWFGIVLVRTQGVLPWVLSVTHPKSMQPG